MLYSNVEINPGSFSFGHYVHLPCTEKPMRLFELEFVIWNPARIPEWSLEWFWTAALWTVNCRSLLEWSHASELLHWAERNLGSIFIPLLLYNGSCSYTSKFLGIAEGNLLPSSLASDSLTVSDQNGHTRPVHGLGIILPDDFRGPKSCFNWTRNESVVGIFSSFCCIHWSSMNPDETLVDDASLHNYVVDWCMVYLTDDVKTMAVLKFSLRLALVRCLLWGNMGLHMPRSHDEALVSTASHHGGSTCSLLQDRGLWTCGNKGKQFCKPCQLSHYGCKHAWSLQ